MSHNSTIDGDTSSTQSLKHNVTKARFGTPKTTLSDDEKPIALARELQKWGSRKAYISVKTSTVARTDSIIGSHVMYRRKLDGSAKVLIVPWGHPDNDEDFLRGDAPFLDFEVYRLLLSLAAENE